MTRTNDVPRDPGLTLLATVARTIGYGVIRRVSAAFSWYPFSLPLVFPFLSASEQYFKRAWANTFDFFPLTGTISTNPPIDAPFTTLNLRPVVFTVSDVWHYQKDFSDTFTYFGLKEDFLPAEIYLERVSKEIENLAKREGTRARWGKNHRGRLDEINNHLGRMDPELILQKNDDGEAIYQDSARDRDLVALAYYQLYNKLTSVAKERKLGRCSQCDGIFDPTNIQQRFCQPVCRRSHHNHKYHEKKKKEYQKA